MNPFNTILVLATAFITVFGETVVTAPRNLLGAQINLLPVLVVFAALNTNIITLSVLAVAGGLAFDSLSANPMGASILPLMAVGFPVYLRRDLILRDLPFAQLVLGAAACAIVPALTLLILLNCGTQPLIGWGLLWQWIVMTAGGAVATPFFFSFFAWCNHMLGYQPRIESSFRPDREILRGRK
jgi:hypothetical protein